MSLVRFVEALEKLVEEERRREKGRQALKVEEERTMESEERQALVKLRDREVSKGWGKGVGTAAAGVGTGGAGLTNTVVVEPLEEAEGAAEGVGADVSESPSAADVVASEPPVLSSDATAASDG